MENTYQRQLSQNVLLPSQGACARSASASSRGLERRCGVHKSVQALEADIRAWIENWNANPRPFAWTKTADEILDSLAKYLARISGVASRIRCKRTGAVPASW